MSTGIHPRRRNRRGHGISHPADHRIAPVREHCRDGETTRSMRRGERDTPRERVKGRRAVLFCWASAAKRFLEGQHTHPCEQLRLKTDQPCFFERAAAAPGIAM